MFRIVIEELSDPSPEWCLEAVALCEENRVVFAVGALSGGLSLSRGDHIRGIGGMRAAASPCGRYLAYFLPDWDGVALMEFRWVGDFPTLEEVRRWEFDTSEQRLRIYFNATGDRIYTEHVWLDRDSDRMIDCGENELRRLPGPSRFICADRNEPAFYEDFRQRHLPFGGRAHDRWFVTVDQDGEFVPARLYVVSP